jgi:hypothetical protein
MKQVVEPQLLLVARWFCSMLCLTLDTVVFDAYVYRLESCKFASNSSSVWF